jgi:hypothetical protein
MTGIVINNNGQGMMNLNSDDLFLFNAPPLSGSVPPSPVPGGQDAARRVYVSGFGGNWLSATNLVAVLPSGTEAMESEEPS